MGQREPVGVNISHCKMVVVRPGVRSSNNTRKGGLHIVNRGLNRSLGMARRDTITPVSLESPRPKRQHLSHGVFTLPILCLAKTHLAIFTLSHN